MHLAGGLRPALAVVDWSLPDGDSATVLDALEAVDARTRVILSTGNEDRIPAGARARAAAVLLKPFRLKELSDLLARLTGE